MVLVNGKELLLCTGHRGVAHTRHFGEAAQTGQIECSSLSWFVGLGRRNKCLAFRSLLLGRSVHWAQLSPSLCPRRRVAPPPALHDNRLAWNPWSAHFGPIRWGIGPFYARPLYPKLRPWESLPASNRLSGEATDFITVTKHQYKCFLDDMQ